MIGSIRFAGDLHPVLVIATAVTAAALVIWLYLRESRAVASPYSYLLPSLRGAAVALTILILAGPVWHRRQTIGTLGRVVFAIDQSASMGVTDSVESGSSPARLDRALRLLAGNGEKLGWLPQLAETHLVDVLAFSAGDPALVWSSRDGSELPTAFDLVADGQRTDLSSGMAATLDSLAPTHVDDGQADPQRAALVLMTDGRDNLGDSPLDLADRLQSLGVRVHAVGMGSEDEPTDVGIVNVVRPENVASDGQLVGEIVLKHIRWGAESSGGAAPPLTVRIESGSEVVWQETLPAGPDSQPSIPFQLDVKSLVDKIRGQSPRGVRRSTVVLDLRAVVESIAGDANAENNSMPFRVAASTRDRRLLILDGSSRWEVRYLRNLFQRDPAWTVDTLLCGPGTDMPTIQRGDQPGQWPDSHEAMAAYDAVVLGEVPPEQFREDDAERLREFVLRGGGLIVLDGRYERIKSLARQSLADLIPVEYLEENPVPVRAIRPSRMGLDHPLLNLWGEKRELEAFWEQLPAPVSAPRIRAREGAEVWADAMATDGRESPWLVSRLFGAGRVFYLSTDQTWRWRYKVADRFHARFWNQLLHAVMQPPYSASDDYVALGTDKVEYEQGESPSVRVRLQDTSGKPVGDATVDALLIAGDRVIATVPLAVDDPARGTYRGQTAPLESGAYEVRVRASGFDSAALQATTPIWVGARDTVELNRVSLDKSALLQIVETAGGVYVHESSAEQILEQLGPLSSGSIVESDVLVWQSFYWFWAILLLLATEWWMRKRAGLV
jgi:uncharacterized membrane protein